MPSTSSPADYFARSPDPSILAVRLWDLRGNIEAQLRCLAILQRSVTDFATLSDDDQRAILGLQIKSDLQDFRAMIQSELSIIESAVEQAREELQADTGR